MVQWSKLESPKDVIGKAGGLEKVDHLQVDKLRFSQPLSPPNAHKKDLRIKSPTLHGQFR